MYYDGSHAVMFGNKHSYDDWFLVPSNRPVITPPQLRSNYIEIPGLDGSIDTSELLAGRPLYNNRTGSIEFVVDTDKANWEDVIHMVQNYIHGKRMKMILLDAPEYYYEGRFEVNALKSDKALNQITINYTLNPFKKRVHGPNPDGERLI